MKPDFRNSIALDSPPSSIIRQHCARFRLVADNRELTYSSFVVNLTWMNYDDKERERWTRRRRYEQITSLWKPHSSLELNTFNRDEVFQTNIGRCSRRLSISAICSLKLFNKMIRFGFCLAFCGYDLIGAVAFGFLFSPIIKSLSKC